MKLRISSAAADPQHRIIIDFGAGPDRAPEFLALRPLDLDGGYRKKQRAGKITLGPDIGLGDGFFGGDLAEPFGKVGGGERLDRNEIDRSGHRRPQPFGGKTRNGADAGFAGGEFLPVVGLAGPERCHDAHPRDDDDRPSELIARSSHVVPANSALHSPDRFDQRHAFAPPMTCPDHYNLGWRSGHFNLQPGGIVGRKQCAARQR